MRVTVVNIKDQPYDVYIGRPSKWGNPFKLIGGSDEARAKVIDDYLLYILTKPNLLEDLGELRGKRLGCFCKPKACHGDVLKDLVEERYP